MLFSSISFIYYFLPMVILIYYSCHFLFKNKPYATNIKNIILLIFSLFFYFYGAPQFLLLLVVSICVNYIFGLTIHYKKNKVILALSILFNLSFLAYYKYIDFTILNINGLFNTNIALKNVILPLGISFFTFQALSYVVDVYREDGKVQKNIFNLALYISFFPQLIAGPIVRYSTFDNQVRGRFENFNQISIGIKRFIYGLSKKVLLANYLGFIADDAFSKSGISVVYAWLGIMSYAFQIYYDFSGYSDMAIGLAKMFGFDFLENFNYPYISKSISEFWRRWHISLGSWFRDYVYFPLGGSRCSSLKIYRNLFAVWVLTGLWHGASYNFILWGLYFFVLISIEKNVLSFTRLNNKEEKYTSIKGILKIFLNFVLVLIGWVLFRANNLSDALNYYKNMFWFNDNAFFDLDASFFLNEHIVIFVVAIIFATPVAKNISKIFKTILFKNKLYGIYFFISIGVEFLLLYLCTISLLASNYNPFIYFNF